MTNRHQDQAEKIISAFQETLDDSVRRQITDAQYKLLGNHIKKALGDEVSVVMERLEGLVKELRTETERPDLGI